MLEKEFKWYLNHQDELVKSYNRKYLVISDNKVVYSSANKDKAYQKGIEMLGLGKFILQLCTPGNEAYTMTFHTHRVHFAKPAYA